MITSLGSTFSEGTRTFDLSSINNLFHSFHHQKQFINFSKTCNSKHRNTRKNDQLKLTKRNNVADSNLFWKPTSNVFDPFSHDLWDPFQGFPFNNTSSGDKAAFVNTRIDWRETLEAHVFKEDLPGLKKEEVKVEVEDGKVLHISGERNREQEEKNDKWRRVERSSGKFLRRFRLPENAKMKEIKANMGNVVLTVAVLKVEEKKP